MRKTGLAAITLREDDELIEVKVYRWYIRKLFWLPNMDSVSGSAETDVRSTGRTSMGVRGINLDDTDEVIGMQLATQGNELADRI